MTMKTVLPTLLLTVAALAGLQAQAQEKVWRCGNEYTNNPADAQKRNCKVMEGGNVTVVQGTRPVATRARRSRRRRARCARPPAARASTAPTSARATARPARCSRPNCARPRRDRPNCSRIYNNGEPEKQGSESRNYQKYLDRVAEMKAEIARNESDIAGIRREIGRLPPVSR